MPRCLPLLLLLLALVPVARAGAAADPADRAEAVLAAARSVLPGDPWPTLITLDEDGRPQARTVAASDWETGDGDLVVWVATNPASRKVAQLRARSAATLHWADDAAGAYVTLLGTATLHDDPATLAAHTFTSDAELSEFWPDYPEGYLLIRIEAERVEVVGGGLPSDAETWAPPGIDVP